MGIELLPVVTLSVTTNVPPTAPFAVGENVTSIVQLLVGVSEAGHRLLGENSPDLAPVIVTLFMSKSVSPMFVNCTGKVLLPLTSTLPKANVFRLNCAIGSMTLAVRLTSCVPALSKMFSIAVSVPTASAVKSTANVQLLPGFNGVPVQYKKGL